MQEELMESQWMIGNMKFYLYIVLLVVSSGCLNRKLKRHDKNDCSYYYNALSGDKIYTELDSPAVYIEGRAKLLEYIFRNLKITDREKSIEKIHLYLVIDPNGKVQSIGFENEVLESVQIKLRDIFIDKGGWNPGRCNNNRVTSKYSFTFGW